MGRILVTGAAGFIGYHLIKLLAKEDCEIVACDNLSRGQMDKEMEQICQSKNVKFINCDLTDGKESQKLAGNYSHIYHLAAINGTKYFYEKPNEVLRVNILSLVNLLEWVKNSTVDKLLFTSSSEVYAGTARAFTLPVPTPEDVPLTIDDVFNPRLSYAGSKLIGELFMINYSRVFDFPMTIIRYHNVYGPRMGYEHVIPEFNVRILKRQNPFKLYGSTDTRAFCYVDDAVMATKMVMQTSTTNGGIIHVGNPFEEIQILDLAKKMLDLFNFHPPIEILPAPQGSVSRRCPDISKLNRLTLFKPQIALNTGLVKTFEWYKHRLSTLED